MKVTKISNVTLMENYLFMHIKTVQEGEKDFTCESCEKSFTQADSLKGQIRNIHKGHKSENTHQNHSQIS